MKALELRIGNYFYAEKSSCLFDKGFNKVTFDTFNDIRFRNAINSMQPIELTEEILLKCGFIPCSIIDNNFNISGMCIWKCNDMFLCDKNGVHIKYLHQLQNLYFALTNKELNIEL